MYGSGDYRNGFGGGNVSAGVCYYLCRLADGTTGKGWFEVVK